MKLTIYTSSATPLTVDVSGSIDDAQREAYNLMVAGAPTPFEQGDGVVLVRPEAINFIVIAEGEAENPLKTSRQW